MTAALIYRPQEMLAEWFNLVARTMPDALAAETNLAIDRAAFIGVRRGGRLAAVVAFTDHRPAAGDVTIHWASIDARWASPDVVGACLRYAFVQLDCQRITGQTPARNESAVRFARGIGFKVEGIVRRGFRDDDAVITGLLREEAQRWIKRGQSDVKERSAGAAGGA